MSNVKCWEISKYARFILNNCNSKSPNSNWKIWEGGPTNEIYISLNDPLSLVIRHGTLILESFSLHGSEKWLKGVRNGDSMLFIHKIKDQSRKFRIKFSALSSSSSITQCLQFTKLISSYVTISNLDDSSETSQNSQVININLQSNDVEMSAVNKPTEITIQDSLKSLLNDEDIDIPLHYQTSNIPTQRIKDFLQICLLDPSFPSFVVEVENSLKEIASENVC